MLSHLDKNNNPTIVDIGKKKITRRSATAQAIVRLPEEVVSHVFEGEINGKKGPVFQTAILAGIMAAKKTAELIPLCHSINLENCTIDISLNGENKVVILCRVDAEYKTGVEMEALTGASVAALTLYDMCKALSHDLVIEEVKLLKKSGGKNDFSL